MMKPPQKGGFKKYAGLHKHNTPEQKAEKKAKILAMIRDGYSITAAAKIVSLGRRTIYQWRDADEEFAAELEDAVESGTDGLEDVAVQRAKDGSDSLLMFMLKARRKEVYSDTHKMQLTGKDNGAIEFKNVSEDSRPTLDILFAEFLVEKEAEPEC